MDENGILRRNALRFVCFIACCLALPAATAWAEPGNAWPLETLQRSDGQRFSGLMLQQTQDEMEFVEVVRPPGKPMYLVVHYYPPASVKSWQRMEEADRQTLLKRIDPLLQAKYRSRIERGRMDDVQLKQDGQWLLYEGKWFVLRCNAGDEAARRAVVRMEQIFRAYSLLLPAATKPRSQLTIRLYGAQDDYQAEIQRRGLRIENPAFYSQRSNLIVAGSDIASFSQLLGRTRQKNNATLEQMEARRSEFFKRLSQLREELKEAGFTPAEIRLEAATRRALWEKQQSVVAMRVSQAQRRNDASFEKVSDAMFRRLYHEAFHAYLENYVFPQSQHQIPVWLNEGLAQIFESGQLDAGVLRIDAPQPELLRALQEQLRVNAPGKLLDLIESNGESFVASHDRKARAQTQYLLAWGLAYYLVFERNLLSADRMRRYVVSGKTSQSPLQSFEKLTGQPFKTFYTQWRQSMLALR